MDAYFGSWQNETSEAFTEFAYFVRQNPEKGETSCSCICRSKCLQGGCLLLHYIYSHELPKICQEVFVGAVSEDQVYVLAVAGHVFTAHLITYLSVDRMSAAIRGEVWALEQNCCNILKLQHRLTLKAVRRTPCACSHCGRSEIMHQGMQTCNIKVRTCASPLYQILAQQTGKPANVCSLGLQWTSRAATSCLQSHMLACRTHAKHAMH